MRAKPRFQLQSKREFSGLGGDQREALRVNPSLHRHPIIDDAAFLEVGESEQLSSHRIVFLSSAHGFPPARAGLLKLSCERRTPRSESSRLAPSAKAAQRIDLSSRR